MGDLIQEWWEVGVFLLATLTIVLVGPRLCMLVDALGDRYHIGKTLAGAVILGAVTSLPGIVTSVTAALRDQPELAAANAVGGIAAQTVFLVIADLCYRRANLEHDAASIGNIVQSALLLVVLTIPLAASMSSLFDHWAVHPATGILVLVYFFGLRLVRRSSDAPMWLPAGGEVSGVDDPVDDEEIESQGDVGLLLRTLVSALLVGGSGYALTLAAGQAVDDFGISEGAIGSLGTAVVTSLPELVTTIAAVRRGALSIAVGGIMGGNAFDVLFLAAADVAWLDGSIYHAASPAVWFQLTLTCTMVGFLLLGLALRQRRGPGNVGFEGLLVIGCYLLGALVMVLTG